MTQGILSPNIDPNKVFIVQRSEIEDRWDPMYYRPEIAKLEKKIREISTKKLRDYIVRISSGATPSVKEEEKYYSDKENGIPFLRVQNLQTNGKLSLEDVKYINKETHEGYLRRSQVSEGNLLVKITGVGRMAIASVAPNDFVGNTNQHMVVIKTDNRATSEYLANYLNLDIIEKLASRRSTGGTRPALDYPALKSIPIVEGIDFAIIKEAEELKQQKENEAKALLATIDDYLLGELGIELPKKDDKLNSRIFSTHFSNISGDRWDPNYILLKKLTEYESIYTFYTLSEIAIMYQPQTITQQEMNDNAPYKVFGANGHIGYYHDFNHEDSEVLITCRGATCGEINMSEPKSWITGNAMVVKLQKTDILKDYLFNILKTLNLDSIITGSAQPQITRENLKKFRIPIPPIEKQNEITEKITQIRLQAKTLQQEANDILEQAKKQIEEKILRETL